MTVLTETSVSGPYAGAGTTGPFTVDFRFLADSHLQVIRTSTANVDTTLTLTTDYTVSGAGGASGTVTLVTALAVGEKLTIARDVPFVQLADYVNNDAFPAESHEDALDLLTMQAQQLEDGVSRSLTLPITAVGVSTQLPLAQSSTIIGWNADADALQNFPISSLATAITATTWQTEIFNGTGAQTVFTLASDPGSTSAVLASVGGVVQVPGVDFSMSGVTLTFLSGAPPSGTGNVVVQYGESLTSVGTSDLADVTGTLAVANGGTGATTAAAARTALGVTPANIGAAASGANTDITSLTAHPVGRMIAQVQTFQTGAVATGATLIPYDDTIPQITEGDQYLSLAITPQNAASTLEIDVSLVISSASGSQALVAALFRDSTANAIASTVESEATATFVHALKFKHVVTAGSTATTTFKVRAGGSGAFTVTVNGFSGGRLHGGVLSSRITITEYLP